MVGQTEHADGHLGRHPVGDSIAGRRFRSVPEHPAPADGTQTPVRQETMLDLMAGHGPTPSLTPGEVLMISVCLPTALIVGVALLVVYGVCKGIGLIGTLAFEGVFGG